MNVTLLNQNQLNKLSELETVLVTAHGYYFKLEGSTVRVLKQLPQGWVDVGRFDSAKEALNFLNK
jgi:uncharacterized protein YbdZ (MbtH family)